MLRYVCMAVVSVLSILAELQSADGGKYWISNCSKCFPCQRVEYYYISGSKPACRDRQGVSSIITRTYHWNMNDDFSMELITTYYLPSRLLLLVLITFFSSFLYVLPTRSMLKFQLYDHTGPRATLFHHQTPRIGLVQNPSLGPQHLLTQGGGLPHLFPVPLPYCNALA